jgi:hypothetical protein
VFLIISLGLKFLFPLNCWYDLICTASLHTWRMKKSKTAFCIHLLIGNVSSCRWLQFLFSFWEVGDFVPAFCYLKYSVLHD